MSRSLPTWEDGMKSEEVVKIVDCLGPPVLREMPVPTLCPNPFQPRQEMTYGSVGELADSIDQGVLIHPIAVIEVPGQSETVYYIGAGHSRWRAYQVSSRERILSTVRRLTRPEHFERVMRWIVLTENIHRRDLKPLEEARAFAAWRDQGFTQAKIAEQFQVSSFQVSMRLGLLSTDQVVQTAVEEKKVDGHEAVRLIRNLRAPPSVQRKMVAAVVAQPVRPTGTEQRRIMLLVAAEHDLHRESDGQSAAVLLRHEQLQRAVRMVEAGWEDLLTVAAMDLSTLAVALRGLTPNDRVELGKWLDHSFKGVVRLQAALAQLERQEVQKGSGTA